MRTYSYIVEKCSDTDMYVGHVPWFPGANSQGATLEELQANIREVIELLLEDGEPQMEGEFVGLRTVRLA